MNGLTISRAALLTQMSMPPQVSTTRRASASTTSGSPVSPRTISDSRPAAAMRSSVAAASVLLAQVQPRDVGPGGGERHGDLGPDPRGAAGDDGPPAHQREGHLRLVRLSR